MRSLCSSDKLIPLYDKAYCPVFVTHSSAWEREKLSDNLPIFNKWHLEGFCELNALADPIMWPLSTAKLQKYQILFIFEISITHNWSDVKFFRLWFTLFPIISCLCWSVVCSSRKPRINFWLAKSILGREKAHKAFLAYVVMFDICFEMITDCKKSLLARQWYRNQLSQKACQYCAIFLTKWPSQEISSHQIERFKVNCQQAASAELLV